MTQDQLESLRYPAWWDHFIRVHLSSKQLSDLATDLARLRPMMPDLMRAFRASYSLAAHFGHREHPDRSMVNAQIGAS